MVFRCWIAIAVLVTFSNVYDNGFHFDDYYGIVDNQWSHSIRNWPRYLIDDTTLSTVPNQPDYRPLLQASYAATWSLVGESPWLWRALHVLLHMIVTFSVLELAIELTGDEWAAAGAALLFAVHPIACELVNYNWARSSLLVAALLAPATVLWIRRQYRPVPWLYALALLAKAEAGCFLAIAGVEYVINWPGDEKKQDSLIQLSTVTLGYLIIRMTIRPAWLQAVAASGIPRWQYALTQPRVWWVYVSQLVAPFELVVDDQSLPLSSGLMDCRLIFAALAWALVIWLVWRRGWCTERLLLCWWFVALAPTSSIFPLAEAINGHRSYLGAAFLAVAAGYALSHVHSRDRRNVSYIVVAGTAALAWCSFTQNDVWKSDITLWRHASYYRPRSPRAHMNYGLALMKYDMPDAELELKTAAELGPDYVLAWVNLGIWYQFHNHTKQADQAFGRAKQLAPAQAKMVDAWRVSATRSSSGSLPPATAASAAPPETSQPTPSRTGSPTPAPPPPPTARSPAAAAPRGR